MPTGSAHVHASNIIVTLQSIHIYRSYRPLWAKSTTLTRYNEKKPHEETEFSTKYEHLDYSIGLRLLQVIFTKIPNNFL